MSTFLVISLFLFAITVTRPGMNGVICHPRIVIVSDFKMTVADDNQTISQKVSLW